MLSNELETKAKLDYKHKIANLRSVYLRKIRNELSGLNFDIPFITLIEAYYKKKSNNTTYKNEIHQFEQPINNFINLLSNNNEQVLTKNIDNEDSSSKFISNDSSVFEKVIKNKNTKRHSLLNLISDSSTETIESNNHKSKSTTTNKKSSTNKSKNKKNQKKNKYTKNVNLKINTIVEQKSFLSILSDSISFLKFNKSNK